jgi:SAM-dependent methyltransferase
MEKISDQGYLKEKQYHSPVNLNHRIILHERFSTNPTPWTAWVFEHLAVRPGQKILAVGCGNATQWRENQARFPKDAWIMLMDLSSGMLRDAKLGLSGDERFAFLSGDAQALPFQEKAFDRVTANHMLYHVPVIENAVAACARLLKPEGVFMAATNGNLHMIDYHALLSEFDPDYVIPDRAMRRFGLQNGADYLKPFFAEVHRVEYECDLWVTEPQPLVDYAFSMWDVQDTIAMEKAKAMGAFFARHIQGQGGIRIRKQTGVFLASHQKGLIESLGVLKAEQ